MQQFRVSLITALLVLYCFAVCSTGMPGMQVAAGGYHTVGLKADGSVVAVGLNDIGQVNVGNWSNIVQVTTGFGHTVGLKADGTVVLTSEADPFVQVADMLQADKAYKAALVAMDADFVANVLKQIKMDKKAAVKFTSHIAKGDAKTVMEIKVK